MSASDIKNAKILDGTTTFTVELDTDKLSSKTLTLPNGSVVVTGSSDYTVNDVDLSSIGNITVVGTSSSLSSVNASMLSAKIDLTNVTLQQGENTVPVTVILNNSSSCWISGSYTATIYKD